MPSTRLLLVAIGIATLLGALVVGAAVDALRSTLRRPRDTTNAPKPPSTPRVKDQATKERPAPTRYTPRRTRLRWYSPEIAAVLLLSLAAGLWLARLAG